MFAGLHVSDRLCSYRLVGPFADPVPGPMDLSDFSLNQSAPIEPFGDDLSTPPAHLASLASKPTETTDSIRGTVLPDDVSRPRLAGLPSSGADQADRFAPARPSPEPLLDPSISAQPAPEVGGDPSLPD
jgi:hypothetical protein